uniref:T-box domain-containing protein n=1 Tax=Caenorhabditis tropicalis TaxID=1561998 RepID=A0A1I7U9R9_9PELO
MNTSIDVSLFEKDLWMEVYPNLEMLARSSEVCPELKFSLAGLEKEQHYKVFVSLERYGEPKRFSFDKEKMIWKESKRGYKKPHQTKIIEHSLGIQSGEIWMEGPVEFSKIKISAKEEDEKMNEKVLMINTHHKYIPVIRIMNVSTNMESRHPIEEAQFIPVTEYLNKTVSDWKCRNNKYTTLRNGGQGKRKAAGGEPQPKRSRKGAAKEKPIVSGEAASMGSSSTPTTSNTAIFAPTANFDTHWNFYGMDQTAQMQFQPYGQAPYCTPMTASMNGYNTQWNPQYHMDYNNYNYYYNYPVFNPYTDPTFSVNSTFNSPQSSSPSTSTPSPVTFNSENIPPPVHFPHF